MSTFPRAALLGCRTAGSVADQAETEATSSALRAHHASPVHAFVLATLPDVDEREEAAVEEGEVVVRSTAPPSGVSAA